MRIPLNFSQSPVGTASAPRLSPPKQNSFADRLAATRKTEPKQPSPDAPLTDDSEAQAVAALREQIKQYLLQNALMQRIMCTPGPLPSLDTD